MSDAAPTLDLGKLLRLRAMVVNAAQVEVTHEAARALVRAYMSLRDDLANVVRQAKLPDLYAECLRLFPDVEEPPPTPPNALFTDRARPELLTAASDAQVGLRKLEGFIQGLLDEQTLREKLRLEAEATAKLASKPSSGEDS